MKKLFTPILGLLMMLGTQAQAETFETATEAVASMAVGWNLGNTLDAANWEGTGGWNWDSPVKHETYWGQPVTKPELLKMMKEAGFGAIRVPVTWFQEMDSDGKVNEAWMKRVKEVVDYVIDNGMYCILNVHHDTGAESATHWVVADKTVYNNTKARFEYLWTQIATEFKDYDQHLLFEAYNEMLDKYNSWNYATSSRPGGYDATEASAAYDAINSYAQSFVNAVRATGGNNAQRNLVINTYSAATGGTWDNNHPQEVLTSINLPTDNAQNHLIFQVHYYPGLNKDNLSNIKSDVTQMLNRLKNNLMTKGAPVIVGEWGTINDDSDENYNNNKANYLDFCKFFVKQAKNRGITTFYWMGLSDGAARNLPAFHQPDLAETIVKAYRGDSYEGKYPSVSDFPVEYVVTYEEEWAELFLFGNWDRKAVNLSDYKGIRVEMDAVYGNKLQIKVYGEKIGSTGDTYKEQYAVLSDASTTTTVEFDASILGSTFWGVTLQTNSGPMTAKVKKATLIKADDTEVPGTVTSAWGCTVVAEIPTGIHEVYTATPSDDAIYNLQGQRIHTPTKGIYIKNGKKYIAK